MINAETIQTQRDILCLLSYEKQFDFHVDNNDQQHFYYRLFVHLYTPDDNQWITKEVASTCKDLRIQNASFVHTTHGDLFITDGKCSQILQLATMKLKNCQNWDYPFRFQCALAFHNFNIYLMGGRTKINDSFEDIAVVEEFNLITN